MVFQTLSNSAGHPEPFHSQHVALTFLFLMPPLPPNYALILTFSIIHLLSPFPLAGTEEPLPSNPERQERGAQSLCQCSFCDCQGTKHWAVRPGLPQSQPGSRGRLQQLQVKLVTAGIGILRPGSSSLESPGLRGQLHPPSVLLCPGARGHW